MSTAEQRREWGMLARFVSQLGLAEGEELPVAQVEELANGVMLLLDEVERLRAQRNEARAWAWSEFHREYDGRWLATVNAPDLEGGWDYDLPEWLTDPRTPVEQEWWPAEPDDN